ncbi:TIR domain-containing protein, partial [candidate division KSB3 bacterium]|nr:TIR domain-containing protein [candidate division KSB3 bacterium]MBD3324923.1 TIR domain-containing protein [candidate division KSB3 bacterium]
MKHPKVFISYSSKDQDFARKLASDLKQYDIETWIDITSIRVGDTLTSRIQQGIEQADYILMILSENSVNSKWVQEEIRAAYAQTRTNAEKILIPIVLEGEYEIPVFLRDIVYADFSKLGSYQKNLRRLVAHITKETEEEKPTPTELLNPKDFAREIATEVAQILKVNSQGIRENDLVSEEVEPDLVFVIIADFSTDMDPIFEGIKEAGAKNNLRVERIKHIDGDYKIIEIIIEMIRKARFIVADLTYQRGNIYFELGFARGLG